MINILYAQYLENIQCGHHTRYYRGQDFFVKKWSKVAEKWSKWSKIEEKNCQMVLHRYLPRYFWDFGDPGIFTGITGITCITGITGFTGIYRYLPVFTGIYPGIYQY